MKSEKMIIVSACLVGVKCRYDGKDNTIDEIVQLVREGKAIPLCPEQLGGLSTPRLPSEIVDCQPPIVINQSGEDISENFIKGAYETLNITKIVDAEYAILKANSPSCGYGKIYNGTFSRKLINGNGITADLLSENGLKIFNEHNFNKIIL